ncbi:MAG: YkvI family membrane protein [Bacilli bacterium]
MNKNISSLQIAAIYVGTVIGAGFATGREIVTFFSVNGWYGFLGIFISGLGFCWFGTHLMLLSKRWNVDNAHQFNRKLFGTWLAPLVSVLTFIIVLSATSVMLSGAHAIFTEQLHVPVSISFALSVMILLFFIYRGMNGLVEINGIVVPFMFIFTAFVSISAFTNDLPMQFLENHIPFSFSSLFNPLLYVAFNIFMGQIVLVPIAKNAANARTIIRGGVLGGLLLTLLMFFVFFAVNTLPQSSNPEIPMGSVLQSFSTLFHLFFSFIMLGEIGTTVIGNVFGLSSALPAALQGKKFGAILLLIALSLSVLQYSFLLDILYPLYGWLSILLLPLIIYHSQNTNWTNKKT